MSFRIEIDKSLKVSIYQQITVHILTGIETEVIQVGDMLPSINQVARENGVARETVIKSFSIQKFLKNYCTKLWKITPTMLYFPSIILK